MTAKELANELLKHPDFKVRGVYVDYFANDKPKYFNLKILGISDIGYSDKVIVLDLI